MLFRPAFADCFHWILGDSKCRQVFRTLLSILADLNNAVVWMIAARTSISIFTNPNTKPLGIISSAPITIDITVTFIFHSFFSSLARSKYSSSILFSLIFTQWFTGTAKSIIWQVLWLLLSLLLLLLFLWEFFPPGLVDGLPSESKWQQSPQVSWTLLRYWPILILSFGWSPLILLFPNLPLPK